MVIDVITEIISVFDDFSVAVKKFYANFLHRMSAACPTGLKRRFYGDRVIMIA